MNERKILHEISQLDQVIEKNKCVLYGAGKVSRIIVKHLAQQRIKVEQILVSFLGNNPNEIMGIPISEITKYDKKLEDKCLVICANENLHEELINEVIPYKFEYVFCVSNELVNKILYDLGDYEVECYYQLKINEEKIDKNIKNLMKFVPKPCMEYMVLNILDHCNLRCQGCDHFACVADEYLVPYDKLHKDLDRLSEILHGDHITKIAVMGGEPLLHPDLLEILKDVRRHFPYAIIRLTTNGLLLLKQKQDFWRVCRENNVTIVNTKYPINLDFDGMKQKAEQEKVQFEYFSGSGDHIVKKSFKKCIDLKGDGDPVANFARCNIANYGNFLMEGKLYGCPFACQSFRIFNKKFEQNLRMVEGDYLDIYKVKNMQEIFDFAARPKYYCRYCKEIPAVFNWARSKGDINEWKWEANI